MPAFLVIGLADDTRVAESFTAQTSDDAEAQFHAGNSNAKRSVVAAVIQTDPPGGSLPSVTDTEILDHIEGIYSGGNAAAWTAFMSRTAWHGFRKAAAEALPKHACGQPRISGIIVA